jgi:hypothetical protein
MEEILQELFCTAEIADGQKGIREILGQMPSEHIDQLN